MNNTKPKIADDLKQTMRRLPYPVTIVTAAVGQEKRGITIGSFTSLSLDPPLISFNVDFEAQMNPLIKKATHFSVHIPASDQAHLCNHFAVSGRSGNEQFISVEHQPNQFGTPILKDVPCVLHCGSYTWFETGDHSIIVGKVLDVERRNENTGLLYYDQSYHSIGQPADSRKKKRTG